MNKNVKYSMMFAAALMLSAGVVSCGDDNDAVSTPNGGNQGTESQKILNAKLATVNSEFVNNTVLPTYRTLADDNKKLVEAIENIKDDATVEEACKVWKQSRKWWEFSEAFLFGPAGDFGIDPHTDTWPFDRVSFDNYMSKYHPATDEGDALLIDDAIKNGKNLTGFHAVEYLIFRKGEARKFADITADELYFAKSAAQDLYVSSLKLVSAWGGEVSEAEQKLLDDEEFESKNYGEEFVNAGKAGSSYATILLASRQIIAGANEIIGEVRDSKIGAPATGADVNYIESPHAYNSIQDFYDNIMSCKHALYGGATMDGITPSATSLIGVCLQIAQTKSAAEKVENKLEAALAAINNMERPFVLNYTDQSAKTAMSALDELETSLRELDKILENYE